jgi:hypothetical protein
VGAVLALALAAAFNPTHTVGLVVWLVVVALLVIAAFALANLAPLW